MALIEHNVDIPNSGNGDALREAFVHQNSMNTELYEIKVDKVLGKDLSDQNYTIDEKNKLLGIEEGAEVNVQPDWNQNDDTQDDYIRNKPTLSVPTNTSDLINDGDGTSAFVTAEELGIELALKEDVSNKVSDFTVVDDVTYPSTQAVSDFVDNLNATDVGALPNSTTSATPILADKLIIKDVSDSNNSKEITLTDLKTVIGTDAIKDEQIEVSANTDVLDAWNGKTILVTASCTITVPATLMNSLMFVGRTLAGATITWAITSPFTWETTPTTTTEKKTFSFMRRGSTNTILFDS